MVAGSWSTWSYENRGRRPDMESVIPKYLLELWLVMMCSDEPRDADIHPWICRQTDGSDGQVSTNAVPCYRCEGSRSAPLISHGRN